MNIRVTDGIGALGREAAGKLRAGGAMSFEQYLEKRYPRQG